MPLLPMMMTMRRFFRCDKRLNFFSVAHGEGQQKHVGASIKTSSFLLTVFAKWARFPKSLWNFFPQKL
jgi:hypothetical protein